MSILSIEIDQMFHLDKSNNGNLIENIDLQIEGGKLISFLGPSGAGKTTLLRIISGLEKRFIGAIRLNSQKLERPSRDIQVVFQDNRLFPWMTVSENLEFSLKGKNLNKIDLWLDKLNMQKKKEYYIKNLSGGEEARISFARAFMDSPKVLLLDEPFRNLDVKSKFQIMSELIQFHNENKDTIIILVSHSIDDSIYLSDEIHILAKDPMKIIKTYKNIELKHKTILKKDAYLKSVEIGEILSS